MLGNAFAAEITTAFWTAGHGFAMPVIETALKGYLLHYLLLKEKDVS